MSTINKFARVDKDPLFTPYGYVVTEDGTSYSLIKQSCHGVVLAFLFPELAKQNGYKTPSDDPNVFYYQAFELDHARETTAIRISISMSGQLYISKGKQKITPEQLTTLQAIFKIQGLKAKDHIETDNASIPVALFIQENS